MQALGTNCSSVVRTRIFVVDITRWAEFAQAHREFFAENPPVTSMIGVSTLIDPAMLIEIEAEAVYLEPTA